MSVTFSTGIRQLVVAAMVVSAPTFAVGQAGTTTPTHVQLQKKIGQARRRYSSTSSDGRSRHFPMPAWPDALPIAAHGTPAPPPRYVRRAATLRIRPAIDHRRRGSNKQRFFTQ